uniref:EF-hand domain-containing protein n=1 Tax=Romanomermis culicivorax TaxID=13658 RepID=A0A915JII7_ROMCU
MENNENTASTENGCCGALCIDNGLDLSQEAKEKFTQALQHQLHLVTAESLDLLRSEISAYDPHDKGFVDSSSLKRIFAKHYKLIPIDDAELQLLLRIFAVNIRKCHLVKYLNLLTFLDHLISNDSEKYANNHYWHKASANELKPNASTSQSPCYRRGDAKLISDLQRQIINNDIKFVDADQIRRELSFADRGHKESLSREQIEKVFKNHEIFDACAPIFDRLLNRCSLIDNQYKWSELANFLEKAAPGHERDRKIPNHNIVEEGGNDSKVHKNGDKSAKMKNSPSFSKLAQQLSNLDSGNTGNIGAFQAQNVIQKYNNLHQLGLDSRKLGHIMAEASEHNGQRMNLNILMNKLTLIN